LSSDHIGIRAERWNEIIEVITKRGLLVAILSATSGGADGVGLKLECSSDFGGSGSFLLSQVIGNVGGFVLNNPLVAKSIFSSGEVVLGIDNVRIELGGKVVIDVLGFVVILSLGFFGSHDKLVGVHSLGNRKTVAGANHVGVTAVIDDCVVKSISKRSLLVSILGASSRAADRIRVDLDCLSK
jgi:hypothetical protein